MNPITTKARKNRMLMEILVFMDVLSLAILKVKKAPINGIAAINNPKSFMIDLCSSITNTNKKSNMQR